MKSSFIIKNQLKKIGNQIYLTDGEWISSPFSAYIYPLWRKKSSAFELAYTETGIESKEYYLYIGPCDHDITALSDDAEVIYNDCRFCFLRRDAVKISDETVYYTGILKKIKEGEYVEY